MRVAQRGASRGGKLTESLLAFARKQRLDPVPADLNSVVVEISEMLRRSIGASVEFKDVLVSDLWPVLVDVSQIEAALLNVALNARDAMPEGGVLVIETANIRARDKELPAEVAGHDCVLVSLRDTGTGMTPEVVERAFEPFFTTKDIGKGTGLGLSMVFGVVRQSGGAVRIRSRLREGTTVQIYLPRTIEAKAPGPRRAVKPQTAEKAYVLVVDDDPDVRWITSEDLREIGYLVTEADSGRAALAILERGGPCDLKPVLPLDTLLNGIAAHPSLPEYWWLYALLLSTMIPSLVNLVIGGASLVRGLPGLPSLLLRKIPAQGNVPKFDRAWIATVLTAQVAAGAALGIAAQTFLVVVIIGYTMPWLGLGLLDMARDVAAFNLPARVGQLFGVSL